MKDKHILLEGCIAYLRVPPTNAAVVLQRPQEGGSLLAGEEALSQNYGLVLGVNTDEQHQSEIIPAHHISRTQHIRETLNVSSQSTRYQSKAIVQSINALESVRNAIVHTCLSSKCCLVRQRPQTVGPGLVARR